MPNLATATLIGHMGKQPELSYTPSGAVLCKFSVAVSIWHGAGKEDTTDWYNCTAWGKLGERINEKIGKGQLVYVHGKQEIRKWTGKDGKPGVSVEVRADDVIAMEKTQASPEKDEDGDDLPF